MNPYTYRLVLVCQLVLGALLLPSIAAAASGPEVQEAEPEKGPHAGRMLRDGDFAIELAIFETGVPPEFRVWVTNNGEPVAPAAVELRVQLTRLGNVVDDIGFRAEDDYLRGDTVIYEPHSFVVTLTAAHQGKTHRWEYDNFEGRTLIADPVADAMSISTETAGVATLHQIIRVYGTLVLPPDAKRQIQARFDGEVKQMHVKLGDQVSKGQALVTIESNESLKTYQITAPMDGVISQQFASTGEQSAGRTLLEITRTGTLLAELAVYPMDRPKVKAKSPVTLTINGFEEPLTSTIRGSKTGLRDDQARLFLAEVDNTDGLLSEGLFITGDIEVDTFTVPLAVKRAGLQSFRDFTVVYAKVGEEYEVRMLELGREAGPWVEVLGGLEPGTVYVTENSYIIKADIEKSGASHDH
ncbi:HlyD family efflux transporter periplasmic adaptor subunit [Haliea sp. E1-2-M8]|uniref:efflux RND transporter periplasmic adaptor subunit n=1 Tax=Haliea sp. E1-2-M8 TaxID=3064706 RepID=UPI002721D2D2|nr:HlyD family efflux transporter periplasmic adaptor subunit [Haliea sp. E1-2-M8]MDO8862056.1 HlyD family efflux transporter periplasmic adaptor subunit [Haliea sp. E1-2-M8]